MKNENTYYDYLAFFRVYLALHIIKKYLFYFPHIDLLYGESIFHGVYPDPILSFLNISQEHSVLIMTLLLISALLMLFGVGKNTTIFFVFIFLETIHRLNGYLLNGGDNLLKFIMIYMMFANSFTRLTLFEASEISPKKSKRRLLHDLSVLAIKIHVCLIYFISGITKANSKVWFNGVATYYTLSLERFSGSTLNKYIAQSGLFITVSTYTTLLWELFFPVLVWNKKLKYPMLVVGFMIHIGIYFLMMIHDFEILFIATYGLFIPDKDWRFAIAWVKKKLPWLNKEKKKELEVFELKENY